MNAARLRQIVKQAAKEGAAEALCSQCIFDSEGINILNTVIKIGLKFKGFIILGLTVGMILMCINGGGMIYLFLSGGLG